MSERSKIDLDNYFGEALKQVRTEKGLTQAGLAELCNLDVSYISMLERGVRQPSLEVIIVIAQGLKIDASELVIYVEKQVEKNSK